MGNDLFNKNYFPLLLFPYFQTGKNHDAFIFHCRVWLLPITSISCMEFGCLRMTYINVNSSLIAGFGPDREISDRRHRFERVHRLHLVRGVSRYRDDERLCQPGDLWLPQRELSQGVQRNLQDFHPEKDTTPSHI